MSDILVLDRSKKAKKRKGKVAKTLRVLRGGLWIGDILLDRKDRVWRKVDSIPADIVLKALAAATRGDDGGELVGRRDGLLYTWHVVVPKEETQSALQVDAAFAEAA